MSTEVKAVDGAEAENTRILANGSDPVHAKYDQCCASVFETAHASVEVTNFNDVAELKKHLENPTSTVSRLYTLTGLPLAYVQVFGAHFGLTPEFVNSHARREPYRLRPWHRKDQKHVNVATFCYPELVEWKERGSYDASDSTLAEKPLDDATISMESAIALEFKYDDPQRAPYEGALLCHASIWSQKREDGALDSLLFLDDPIWADPKTTVSKPIYRTGPLEKSLDALASTQHVEWDAPSDNLSAVHSSFADLASYCLLNNPTGLESPEQITTLLHEITIAKWEVFISSFESFVLEKLNIFQNTKALSEVTKLLREVCFAAQSYLQGSIVISTSSTDNVLPRGKQHQCPDPTSSLLSLNGALNQCSTAIANACTRQDEYAQPPPQSPTPYASRPEEKKETSDTEAKRSLDRIGYITGFLLPFTAIASMLAMGGDFAAGAKKFYVYWVITIPLSFIILTIIYADTIRRMTGWEYLGEEEPRKNSNDENGL